ncbi:alpha-1,3-arabinosyltransferase XAT2-like isoform X2 [Oryza glaberrima]|uniref:alpha-1,3-arabinosyltransferase XAT2-like isoform X2 n=1 Tax=Oryza glaberrima TaxID=4538 RepID=UPI00224C3A5B|nr:alpha-1,3-arabinosyltransferase XAT2-like isoform X2 [Oryza glaberrima]
MKPGGSSGRLHALRFESQRFRLLTIVVGCFLISLTFLLSSRPDATVFSTLNPRESLEDARMPAMKMLHRSSSAGLTRDFHVDILPQQGDRDTHAHLQQSVDQTAEKTEWVKDTVIIQEVAGERSEEAEEAAERVTADSGDEAAPAVADEDNAVKTTATVATTARPDQPLVEEKKKQQLPVKLQDAGEPARTPEQTVTSHSVDRRPLCDFSDFRTDICDFSGDVRMAANTSEFVVVVDPAAAAAASHKVRPYPRKGDATCMGRVTEITVRTTGDAAGAPRCTRAHGVPAVAFSIGGYTGNIFHDFSDVIVPLYNTVQRYRGGVQLVMANVASWWLVKYDKLLRELSRHAPIDLAKAGAAGEVHCFPSAVVSLRAHRELIIERERSLDGLATPDFTRFLRRALSLPRDAPTRLGDGTGRRPRLLVISRGRTRLLLNLDAVVRAAEEVGFEVVVNESDVGNSIEQVGKLINSCDALLGVHGAGLTNMMFLPPGATMVQVVPWGGLQWIARMDYGEPAAAMGLNYIQYEIAVAESSLKDKYPAGDEIFTNPTGLHKRGFAFMKQTLMDGQDITIDVTRFRPVLQQALHNLAAK